MGPWLLVGRWFSQNALAFQRDPVLLDTLRALERDFYASLSPTASLDGIRLWIDQTRQRSVGNKAAMLDTLRQSLNFPY